MSHMKARIKLTINGRVCSGRAGQTILEVAQNNGIEIPNLCHNSELKHYGGCSLCVVEAENSPKLLRACATEAQDGQVIYTESERVVRTRKTSIELLMSDHDGDCRGPCVLKCPASVNAQGYVQAIARGDDKEAVRIIKERLPIPASIGRVCPHPCEGGCRRQMVEQSISIAYLKYFAADRVLAAGGYVPPKAAATGKRVGVIGGGPGGLTAAYYLSLKGNRVTVVDSMPQMGGMLRYGIPEYRLPKKVLDQEIDEIASLGVEMKNNFRIGEQMSFEEFKSQYDAVVLAIGAWSSTPIGCPGEELEGVMGGIDFLRQVAMGEKPDIGDKVAVVGGGNTAMDACRTAVRLGAKEVYVVYRRTEAEMPAEQIEIDEAREEGVVYKFLTNPAEIIGENGKVKEIKLQVMELGEPDESGRRRPVPVPGKFETLPVTCVIGAIGQKVNVAGFEGVQLNNKGIIAADETSYRTSMEGVFAVGDATNRGASIAIEAIGEARRCAKVVTCTCTAFRCLTRRPTSPSATCLLRITRTISSCPAPRCPPVIRRSASTTSRRSTSASPRPRPAPRPPAAWTAAASTSPSVSSSAAPTCMSFSRSISPACGATAAARSTPASRRSAWSPSSGTRASVSSATSASASATKWWARACWVWWAAASPRSFGRSSRRATPSRTA